MRVQELEELKGQEALNEFQRLAYAEIKKVLEPIDEKTLVSDSTFSLIQHVEEPDGIDVPVIEIVLKPVTTEFLEAVIRIHVCALEIVLGGLPYNDYEHEFYEHKSVPDLCSSSKAKKYLQRSISNGR